MSKAKQQLLQAYADAQKPDRDANYKRILDAAMGKNPPSKKIIPKRKSSPKKVRACPPETYVEERLAAFLDYFKFTHTHLANEQASAAARGKLAGHGMTKGMPDHMIFDTPKVGDFKGMAMELKAEDRIGEKNGGATPSQLDVGAKLVKCGWYWKVHHGHIPAIRDVVRMYGMKLTRHERAIFLEE